MKKIVIIIGARPNFMKAFPVYEALKEDFELTLIHTGQHFDAKMSDVFFNQLKFPRPDITLTLEKKTKAGDFDDKMYVNNGEYLKDKNAVIQELMNYDGDLGQLGEIRDKLKIEFEKLEPDLVVVFGDVTSTLSAGLASKLLNIDIVHVESGLRSGDMLMPEEVNRVLTDHITKYYFITEQSGVDNLKAIGVTENVYLVGNTMIDTQKKYLQQALTTKYHEILGVKSREYLLITLHRPSNVDDLNKLKEIFDDFIKLSKTEKLVYPIHPRTKNNLEKIGYLKKVEDNPNIILDEPLGYLEFTCLMANCKYLVTDSGGLQEETTALDIPCFTLRENTERPSTLIENSGTNQMISKISEIELKPCKGSMNLWDGKSSERIRVILDKHINLNLYISSSCNLLYFYNNIKCNFKKIFYTFKESTGISMIDDIMNPESEINKNDNYDIYLLCIGDKFRNELFYPLSIEYSRDYDKIFNSLMEQYEYCVNKILKKNKITFLNIYPLDLFNNSIFSYKYDNSNMFQYYYKYKLKVYDFCKKNKLCFVLDYDNVLTNLRMPKSQVIRMEIFGSHPEFDGGKYLSNLFLNKLEAITNQKKIKCIVVDLDNTMWNGVFRENTHQFNVIHKLRREILVKMHANGIILCVCSKNDENDLEELKKLLKLDKIIYKYYVNWDQKSKNILKISNELNIGLNSIAFFDDNPFERDEVKTNLNQVNVYKETDIEKILYLPEFNDYNISVEGKKRTITYENNKNRDTDESNNIIKFNKYEDYLMTLNFEICFKIINKGDTTHNERIIELIQRTNQQNITLNRFSLQQINNMINNDDYKFNLVQLKDKFGDYGTIGIIIMNENKILELAISCRALGKKVEESIFTYINNYCINNKYSNIDIDCIKTEKNASFFQQFINFGFKNISGKTYSLEVSKKLEYPAHFKYI